MNGFILVFKNNLKNSYILNDPQLYHYFEHVFAMCLNEKIKFLQIINASTSPYITDFYFKFEKKINENFLLQCIKHPF